MDSGKNLLMPGVSKREVLAWASYDFANSGYTTCLLYTSDAADEL